MTAAARTALQVSRRSGPGTKQIAILPSAPFDAWDFTDAQTAVDERLRDQHIDPSAASESKVVLVNGEPAYPTPRRYQNPIAMNRAFYEGDHWQGGSGWIGPHPLSTESKFGDVMNEIALAFTSRNVVREIVVRKARGVVGRPMRWAFVPKRELAAGEQPTPQETAAVAMATKLMTQWLNARNAHALLIDAVCTALFAERGPIRLYVPPGRLSEDAAGNTYVQAPSIEAALALLWPDHPMPEHAAVVCDDDTRLECGVRLYTQKAENPDDDDIECVELCYLDEYGNTVLRTVAEDEDADPKNVRAPQDEQGDVDRYALQMGGRLTMHEIHLPAIVTPQVQQNQRALNLACSVMPRAVVTSGFLERVLLNAQMPGQWETDAAGKKTGRFIPGQYKTGAGTSNFIQGLELGEDDKGNTVLTTPDVKWKEPSSVDSQVAAAQEHYATILHEVSQAHVLTVDDGQDRSGESKKQERVDFIGSLLEIKPDAEAAWRFLLETPLAMAEALAAVPGALTSLVRADVTAHLDAGPLAQNERTEIVGSIGKTVSTETAMLMLDVEDPQAELAKMRSDPAAVAALRLAQGQALTALTLAGAGLAGAAKLLGLSPDDITALHEGTEFTGAPPGPNNTPTTGGRDKANANKPAPAPEPAPDPGKGDGGAKPNAGSGSQSGGQ
jgi:hypothetical protein